MVSCLRIGGNSQANNGAIPVNRRWRHGRRLTRLHRAMAAWYVGDDWSHSHRNHGNGYDCKTE